MSEWRSGKRKLSGHGCSAGSRGRPHLAGAHQVPGRAAPMARKLDLHSAYFPQLTVVNVAQASTTSGATGTDHLAHRRLTPAI